MSTAKRIRQVSCAWRPGPTGVCSTAANHANKPDDFYVNPRYGQACPCCGHNGWHWVYEGYPLPSCQTEATLAALYGEAEAKALMALVPPL